MLNQYHDLPLFFGGYYQEQMLAYDLTRILPEHEREERPIRVPRIVSRIAAAAVLVIGVLGIANMLSAEPGPAESHPTKSMAIDAAANG